MRPFVTFTLLACLTLAACGRSVATAPKYELPGTPGGRLCVNQCREARDFCREKCSLDERQCTTAMQEQAIRDYEAYAQEQYRERVPVYLRPSDFERPEKCATSSCLDDCEHPYQSCFKNCGGKIISTTSCRYFCF